MVKLFVGNLATGTEVDELRELFEKHGEVTECAVLSGFGFVHMAEEAAANAAIAEYHRSKFQNQVINVELSHTRNKAHSASAGECFNCGKKGHLSRDCPEKQETERVEKCYFCNQPGHILSECPLSAVADADIVTGTEDEVVDFRRLSNRKGRGRGKQEKAEKSKKDPVKPGKAEQQQVEEGSPIPEDAPVGRMMSPGGGRLRPPGGMAVDPYGRMMVSVDAFGRVLRPAPRPPRIDPFGRPMGPYMVRGPRPPGPRPSHSEAGYYPQGQRGDPYYGRRSPMPPDMDESGGKGSTEKSPHHQNKKEIDEEEEKRPSKRFLRDSPPPRPKAAEYLVY